MTVTNILGGEVAEGFSSWHFLANVSHSWAGLHNSVPKRPSAKVAPVGYQLATVALKIKTLHSKRWVAPNLKMSMHLGWVARDWRTFSHLVSKSAGMLCNLALGSQVWSWLYPVLPVLCLLVLWANWIECLILEMRMKNFGPMCFWLCTWKIRWQLKQ